MQDLSPTSSTTEPKPTDEPKPEPPAVPDRYDFKLPDGHLLTEDILGRLSATAKDLKLDAPSAQKVADLLSSEATRVVKLVNDMRAGWRDTVKSDPEMGGDHTPKLLEAIGKAKAVIFANDARGLKEFNDAMDLTGAGDHPAIFRGWSRIAAALNEGSHVGGTPLASPPGRPESRPSPAQALYPNLPSSATIQ